MTANEFDASASASASPYLPDETPSAPESLAWLLNLFQEVMTGMMESDATPLQKANAVARLGGLYLKAYQITEVARANKKLVKQIAVLEERLVALEASSMEREEREEDQGEISLILCGKTPPEAPGAAPEGSRSAVPLLVSGSALLPRAAGPLGSPFQGPP